MLFCDQGNLSWNPNYLKNHSFFEIKKNQIYKNWELKVSNEITNDPKLGLHRDTNVQYHCEASTGFIGTFFRKSWVFDSRLCD
jgi:hypothetical protein